MGISRKLIEQAIGGERQSVNTLVLEASGIAEATIRLQSKKHQHLFQFISDDPKEIALDAIAELFESENEELIKLKKWWLRVDGVSRKESEVFIEFRRLIGNQVNDYIFNRYKEKDPSLSRIIRNLKRAISEHMVDGLMLHQQKSRISLETKEKLSRQIPYEVLNIQLSYFLKEISSSVDALLSLRMIFEEALPELLFASVNDMATATRHVFVLRGLDQDEEFEVISNENLEHFLAVSLNEMKSRFYAKYVSKNKLSDEEFAGLFYIVELILKSNYSSAEESPQNYFEMTAGVIDDLTKETYMQRYRNPLEYFVKQTRKHLISEMKAELISALKTTGEGT